MPDMEPIWLSIKLSIITTGILLLIGTPLAYWLSGRRSIFKLVIEALLTMPLVLPPSVLGFYFLLLFNPGGTLGKWLHEHFDIKLVFSFSGLITASVIYSFPFILGPIKSAFGHLPPSIAQASYIMGKSQLTTFFKVLLPTIRSSIYTALVLTFAHTMGEFGIVLMIGGNIPGVTRLASIAIYDSVEAMEYSAANDYAIILFAITFVLVLGIFILNRKENKYPFE